MTEFESAVDRVLRSLDVGDVVTYGEVAVEAGYSPRASRSVGGILARGGGHYAWWRVVNAAGRLVPGNEEEHARRLRAEGIEVAAGRVVGFGTTYRARRPSDQPHAVPNMENPDVDLRPRRNRTRR